MKPTKPGYYKAKVDGTWEPVSVFFDNKRRINIILIGIAKILNEKDIDIIISEFGEQITFD